MDPSSIFLILALLILVVIIVARPFSERSLSRLYHSDQELSALLAERERILEALTELDFDHNLGKVPQEIFPSQRADLVRRGAEVLRKLDIHQEAAVESQPAANPSEGNKETSGLDDELENLIAARRKSREGGAASFCRNCGDPLSADDRFCSNCGAKTT